MAESALETSESGSEARARGLTFPLAWRNLWRNKRRTYLTAGAIAFATLLVSFAMSMQVGMYRDWIEMYAGEEYQSVAQSAVALINRLAETRATEARFPSLVDTFRKATLLEIGFWQMGLDAGAA